MYKIKQNLQKKAKYRNSKKRRKDIIKVINKIKKRLKRFAKHGESSIHSDIYTNRAYWAEYIVAFRWFRRYSDLNVRITERYESENIWSITISW